jgi:hypothetical protein
MRRPWATPGAVAASGAAAPLRRRADILFDLEAASSAHYPCGCAEPVASGSARSAGGMTVD